MSRITGGKIVFVKNEKKKKKLLYTFCKSSMQDTSRICFLVYVRGCTLGYEIIKNKIHGLVSFSRIGLLNKPTIGVSILQRISHTLHVKSLILMY